MSDAPENREDGTRELPTAFDDWLDVELSSVSRRIEPDGISTSIDLTPQVLRRLRQEKSTLRSAWLSRLLGQVAPSQALVCVGAAVAVLLAFFAGFLYQRSSQPLRSSGAIVDLRQESDRPYSRGQRSAQMGQMGQMGQIGQMGQMGHRSVPVSGQLEDLSFEVQDLSRQLAQLRRLRDAAGPTLELSGQDGVQIVIPLDEVLELVDRAESAPESSRLRRVRW